jgi:hypothetical protein
MDWTIGKVDTHRGNMLGYRFSIHNEHRAPLLSITYRTLEEARLSRSVVEAVLSSAVEVVSHSAPDHD